MGKNVREHMDDLIKGLDKGAPEVPPFSTGTQVLDPAAATIESPAADKPRDPKSGQFTGTAPPPVAGEQAAPSFEPPVDRAPKEGAAAPPPAAAAPPTGEAAGEAAAEAAAAAGAAAPPATPPAPAAAAADPWDGYETITYHDEDTGDNYEVRVPKTAAKRVADGYRRRSAYDRAMSFLGNARPVLEPLIVSGQVNNILPILQRALLDPEFGEYVSAAFNRRVTGKALEVAAAAEAHAAGAAAAAPPTPVVPAVDGAADPGIDDPWLNAAVQKTVAPIMAELTTVRGQLDQFRQASETEKQRIARENQERQGQLATLAAAHGDLHQRHPDYFRGNLELDNANFDAVVRFARESRYIETYGLRAGIVMAADYLASQRDAAESPAAAALATVDKAAQAAARATAQSATAVGGGGAPLAPAPPPAAKPVAMRKADGKLKSPREFAGEVLQRAARA